VYLSNNIITGIEVDKVKLWILSKTIT
jgi:hypothetical protein